jgi:NADPH:quinone reductase-like Zn-dependent oxidoreductase
MTRLGATHAINYREQDFVEIVKSEGGADVILDMVGGDYVQRNISAARLNGRIVNIAYQKGFKTEVNFAPVLMKRLSLNATRLRARPNEEKRAIRDALLEHFWPQAANGKIVPVIDSAHAMQDADAAHAQMAKGGHSGKIILER